MTYRAPVGDMLHALRVAGLDRLAAEGEAGDLSPDLVRSILDEAARFAGEVIAPLNRVADRHGATLENGRVALPPGFVEAYRAWVGAGWNALTGPVEHGGQGLPILLNAACAEMWNAACLSFGVAPLLTMGGIEALAQHGSGALKERYLGPLISGEWTATMNLTEPQAGSDLGALRTRAVRAEDGSYRITGAKIYISYGDHDAADNIVHLVLARLPDAPAGTRGISLFLVPKVLPDGSRNDLRCTGLEHKLGLHGSPTCSLSYGDEGGAVGWLIGEENRGLACMFTMMNNARLMVGLQGVAIAERATQAALAYARERRQGRAPSAGEGASAIIEHPDVRRMLMMMRALTAAGRALCYLTAAAIDRARLSSGEDGGRAAEQASLLTPVAKAFSTDLGVEVASLGIQVHGGMGFIEETGAAQHLRDARILPIYEGTNGIQAIDLVTRKLPLRGGAAIRAEIAAMRGVLQRLLKEGDGAFRLAAPRLREAVESLDRATSALLKVMASNRPEEALAAATPYLRLFGIARGGVALVEQALVREGSEAEQRSRIALARFFAEQVAPSARGLEEGVAAGAGSLDDAALALAG